jgi:hypothetical protein
VPASEVSVTAQELYDNIVKAAISPGLRSLGLSGSSGRYSLRCNQCWVLTSLQKSSYSDAAEIRFTLNLLVANRTTWASAQTEKPYIPDRPSAGTVYNAGESSTRIGALLPDGADKWWRIQEGVDPAVVAQDLLDDFERYGLPWLRREMQAQGCDA